VPTRLHSKFRALRFPLKTVLTSSFQSRYQALNLAAVYLRSGYGPFGHRFLRGQLTILRGAITTVLYYYITGLAKELEGIPTGGLYVLDYQ
jgi:hypothetical protein